MNLKRWVTTTNHRDVGILYFVAALALFLVAGVFALLVRIQLAVPSNTFLSPGVYNQLATMHGLMMLFVFISTFAFAFANYFVPIQIGANDLAFPRINALSFWLYLVGGVLAVSGFLFGSAADVGWTFYVPLASKTYSPHVGVDLAAIGALLLISSTIVSTINFLVTISNHRAPGITWARLPMFTWSILFTVVLMLLVFPILGAAFVMLLSDRNLGTHFFDPASGGFLLWAHLFWFFGHPEVYVILFPALGIVAEVLPVFARRPLFARRAIILAWAVASFISMIVWAHHMYQTGIDEASRKFFTIATETISIPFGVTYLCFIATLWRGSIRFRPPMLFALGFIGLFLIGGLTGVFLSSTALDKGFRGTYFLVAHFHYTLAAGVLMGLWAGVYYWFPKMSGRMLDERLAKAHFWASFAGANLIWFPQFLIGEMPRRIATYAADTGWGSMNMLSTVGAWIYGPAQLLLILNLVWSLRRGERATSDPWKGETLEWTLESPPSTPNFKDAPVLAARERA